MTMDDVDKTIYRRILVVGMHGPRLVKIMSLLNETIYKKQKQEEKDHQDEAMKASSETGAITHDIRYCYDTKEHPKVIVEYIPCIVKMGTYKSKDGVTDIRYLNSFCTIDGNLMTKYFDDEDLRPTLCALLMVGYDWKIDSSNTSNISGNSDAGTSSSTGDISDTATATASDDDRTQIENYIKSNNLTECVSLIECVQPNNDANNRNSNNDNTDKDSDGTDDGDNDNTTTATTSSSFNTLQDEMNFFKALDENAKATHILNQTMGPGKMVKFILDITEQVIDKIVEVTEKKKNKKQDAANQSIGNDKSKETTTSGGPETDTAGEPSTSTTKPAPPSRPIIPIPNPNKVRYACRKCRQILFGEEQLNGGHIQNLHNFKRANYDKKRPTRPCQSIFCNESVLDSLTDGSSNSTAAGQGDDYNIGYEDYNYNAEGKLSCFKCHNKIGHFKWSGAQCSCGTWVTPAIQIPMSKIDIIQPMRMVTAASIGNGNTGGTATRATPALPSGVVRPSYTVIHQRPSQSPVTSQSPPAAS